MPDNTIEGVVERSSRLQSSINLYAPVTASMFIVQPIRNLCTVLTWKDEGTGKMSEFETHSCYPIRHVIATV